MALFDLYQLAALYNLRHSDAGFLPNRSDHPPMPPTTPQRPSTTKAASLPPPTLPLPPKTPRQSREPNTVLGLTPTSRGSAIQRRQDGDTDRVDKYDRADYDGYVREDLGCRVFVDYGVFMEHVLHVPTDWDTKWRRAIDKVILDEKFKKHHKDYCRLCAKGGTDEKAFYSPMVMMANAVLGVLSRSKFKGIPSGQHQYYHVNDPTRVRGGVMNKMGLCPDLVLLHNNRPRPSSPKDKTIHWANPLHVLEVKPSGNAICEGKHMPRLVVNSMCSASSFVCCCD